MGAILSISKGRIFRVKKRSMYEEKTPPPVLERDSEVCFALSPRVCQWDGVPVAHSGKLWTFSCFIPFPMPGPQLLYQSFFGPPPNNTQKSVSLCLLLSKFNPLNYVSSSELWEPLFLHFLQWEAMGIISLKLSLRIEEHSTLSERGHLV
jgi:hypothetical protein